MFFLAGHCQLKLYVLLADHCHVKCVTNNSQPLPIKTLLSSETQGKLTTISSPYTPYAALKQTAICQNRWLFEAQYNSSTLPRLNFVRNRHRRASELSPAHSLVLRCTRPFRSNAPRALLTCREQDKHAPHLETSFSESGANGTVPWRSAPEVA